MTDAENRFPIEPGFEPELEYPVAPPEPALIDEGDTGLAYTPTLNPDEVAQPRPSEEQAALTRRSYEWGMVKIPWQDVACALILVALMAAGYWMRSVGRNWDDYTHLHPDERFLSQVASEIHGESPLRMTQGDTVATKAACDKKYPLPPPDVLNAMSPEDQADAYARTGKGGYFDTACSNLNPHNVGYGFYVYGEFPAFNTRIWAEIYNDLTGDGYWSSYNAVQLVGRAASSVADTLTILLIFLIGARLFNRWVGLFAAGFYAFAAFPIQQSHFWTADVFTSFWVVLTIYFAVLVLDNSNAYRQRFAALPWVVGAIAIWIWEIVAQQTDTKWLHDLASYDTQFYVPLLVYLGVLLTIGFVSSLTAEQRRTGLEMITFAVSVIVLFILALTGIIGWFGAIATAFVAVVLMLLWVSGVHSLGGYTGFWTWIAAAYGLWVFDGLAHYDTPKLTPLAVYLVFFVLLAFISSIIRQLKPTSTQYPTQLVIIVFLLILLAVWSAAALIDGTISVEGFFASLVLGTIIAGANVVGLQDYAGFGLAFGASLAGRINVAPLLGLVLLAVIIRGLFTLDRRAIHFERQQQVARFMVGLILAAVLTIIAFRVLQPHAFNGPHIYNLSINKYWQDDLAEVKGQVSGKSDSPPNHQWANRVPYLFPLQNIVLYGLGVLLGLSAVAGVIWAIVSILRRQPNWTRLAIPVAWAVVYFGYFGKNWVTTMRYFLPIYAVLTLLASWVLWEAISISYRRVKTKPTTFRRLAFGASTLTLAVVTGYTAVYGYAFTSIYRHELTRVAASRYFQEFVPGDFGLWVKRDDGTERMINVGIYPTALFPQIVHIEQGESKTLELVLSTNSELMSVVLHRLGDPNRDPDPEVVSVQIWSNDTVQGRVLLGEQTINSDLNAAGGEFGTEYSLKFEPSLVLPATIDSVTPITYEVVITAEQGGPIMLSANIPDSILPINPSHVSVYLHDPIQDSLNIQDLDLPVLDELSNVAYFSAGSRQEYSFLSNSDGVIERIEMPHIGDPIADPDPETMRVLLVDDTTGLQTSGQVTGNFNMVDDGHRAFGVPATIEFPEPFPVKKGQPYKLVVVPDDFLGVFGQLVVTELPWDDPVPTKVCPLPSNVTYASDNASGLCDIVDPGIDPYGSHYLGVETHIGEWDDVEQKRDLLLHYLDIGDYFTISSNRFYDTLSRIPSRWPMTNRYYEALFSGELGLELVESFTSYAQVGPFEWPDEVLPTQNDWPPNWRNEFEAEEAFHVYDHPAVFIFRKTEEYSTEKAAAILDVELRRADEAYGALLTDAEPINVVKWDAFDATQSPTALQIPQRQQATQREGGTWSEMFHRDSILNKYQVIGVIVWWLLMVAIGWMVLPMLALLFPGLPDRGFGVGKLLGWILVAWASWFSSSLGFKTWNQRGLLGLILLLAAINAVIAVWKRHELLAFIRERHRHLLIVEGISLGLFILLIGVRLGNPDLWHQNLGGEKPMDFAYLNGILRSTTFPPIDPWFTGGYINYYYWGWVLVGAPIKALGIIPSIGYNLAVPTVFAMTGIGAFSVAYNIVQWNNERRHKEPKSREAHGPLGNAYIAGVAALMLTVILGNLDTVRVFGNGVARAGGWGGPQILSTVRYDKAVADFQAENGRLPDVNEDADLRKAAEDYNLLDEIKFEFDKSSSWLDGFQEGLPKVLDGEPMPQASNRWYWGPTRVIGDIPEQRGHNAINEMPYFTFLYADLHAHMVAMPMTLLVLLLVMGEIFGAGHGLRGPITSFFAMLLLGLVVGLLKPTNTWDWPTYMGITVVGLTFAAWLGQGRLRGDVQPVRPYYRLQSLLDLRNILSLWPLLLVIPLGMMLRSGLYLYENRSYESKLEQGIVPTYCQSLPEDILQSQIPPACDGLLKPKISINSIALWGFGAIGAVVVLYIAAMVLMGNRFDRRGILGWIGSLVAFGSFSLIAIYPYERFFATAYGKILPWESDKTPLWAYVDIHGVFLFILFSLLLWQTIRWLKAHKVAELRHYGLAAMAGLLFLPAVLLVTLVMGVFGEYRVFIAALPLFAWCIFLFLLPGQSAVERAIYTIAALALALTMAVEMVVLEGDIGRQNTVFKFYIQAWLLFSIASGVGLAWLIRAAEKWNIMTRGVWQTATAILLSIALLYPIMATQARFLDRMNSKETPLTLDGIAYMEVAPHGEYADPQDQTTSVWFNLKGDYQLIRWMQDNVQGSPTIIEAQLSEYRWGSRISIYTGLPTILGWNFHQRQQRNINLLNNMVWNRANNVQAFYTTTDIQTAWDLIRFYHAEYIVVGTLERIQYRDFRNDPDGFKQHQSLGIAKFDQMVNMGLLEVVYQNPVCVMPDIRDVAQCPPDHISTDKIYRVVSDIRTVDDLTTPQQIFGKVTP
ncbi:MAG: hypothetical protein HY862_17130 [Chloroflexi bacterium]|nr:hypothetical protein [Chloroflexota bacterium]